MNNALPTAARFTPDRLHLAVAAVLMARCLSANADGVQAAAGLHSGPVIHRQYATPVIDIAAPNAQGLSHNRYQHYNVDNQGLVLNNSLVDGSSQLAGALPGNSQLQDRAASIILNEVLGHSESSIRGPQEIFGARADYVLANPNGIVLDGASFENTHQATLVAGLAEFDGHQQLLADTRGLDASVTIGAGGASNREGALSFIAPTVEAIGDTHSAGTTTLVQGQNRVRVGDAQVLESIAQPFVDDGTLWGAMHAGRIRIVSTADGTAVRMRGARLKGTDGISVESAGDIDIQGDTDNEDIASKTLQASAGQIRLDAQDHLDLKGVRVQAHSVSARSGGNLTIDTLLLGEAQIETQSTASSWWQPYLHAQTKTSSTTSTQQYASEVVTQDGLELTAGGDMTLAGTELKASGALRAKAGGNLQILARMSQETTLATIKERHNTSITTSHLEQQRVRANGSELHGSQVQLEAEKDVVVQASDIYSTGDIRVRGAEVRIGSVLYTDRVQADDAYKILLWLSTGEYQDTEEMARAEGSYLSAKGALDIRGERLTIDASALTATDISLTSQGDLRLDASRQTESRRNLRNSYIHDTAGANASLDHHRVSHRGAQLTAHNNLSMDANTSIVATAAQLKAGNRLQMTASDRIHLGATRDQQSTTLNGDGWKLSTFARETGEGEAQWSAGAGIRRSDTVDKATLTTQQVTTASAADIAIGGRRSDPGQRAAAIELEGTQLESKGDISLQARDLKLIANQASRRFSNAATDRTVGMQWTGGIDRIGAAVFAEQQIQTDGKEEILHAPTRLKAEGNVTLDADTITSEASVVDAGQRLHMRARTINHQAVSDITKSTLDYSKLHTAVGGSFDYTAITRFVQKLWTGVDQTRFHQNDLEPGLAPWSFGVNVEGGYLLRSTDSVQEVARTNQFSASDISVQAGDLTDAGTHYTARLGTVAIDAHSHVLEAAYDRTSTSLDAWGLDALLRGDTSLAFQDITVHAAGKGHNQHRQQQLTTAVGGSLSGAEGVRVNLRDSGSYLGTHFSSTTGPIDMTAGADLLVSQAFNRIDKYDDGTEGQGAAKLGASPAGGFGSASGGGKYSFLDSSERTATAARFQTPGAVNLRSGQDITLRGTHIGSVEQKVTSVDVLSGGRLIIQGEHAQRTAKGQVYGGSGKLSVGVTDSQSTHRPIGVGGDFTLGQTDESSTTHTAARWQVAGGLALTADADHAQALHLEGVEMEADSITLRARRGGIDIAAGQSTASRNNKSITAKANLGTDNAASALNEFGLEAKITVDALESRKHTNTQLLARHLQLDSSKDLSLAGAVLQAQRLEGTVGGTLAVSSVADRTDSLNLDFDGRLKVGDPLGFLGEAAGLAGKWGEKGKEQLSQIIRNHDTSVPFALSMKLARENADRVAQTSTISSSEDFRLNVANGTHLNGAVLTAGSGAVELGNSPLTLSDQHHLSMKVSMDVQLANGVLEIAKQLQAGLSAEDPYTALIDVGAGEPVIGFEVQDITSQAKGIVL
jgi:hemolysin